MAELTARPATWIVPGLPRPAETIPSVDRATMLAADQAATDELGIGLLQMMENAGRELAILGSGMLGGSVDGARILVLAGTGNNGGGGMVAARRLAGWGADVTVAFARPVLHLRPGPCAQLDSLIASGAQLIVAGHDRPYPEIAGMAARSDLVVDALIGYNLGRPPDTDYEALMAMTAVGGGAVLSLDVPSGIDATTGLRVGAAVAADATLALALPKVGTTIGDGVVSAGRLFLADVGIPTSVFVRLGVPVSRPFSSGPLLRLS